MRSRRTQEKILGVCAVLVVIAALLAARLFLADPTDELLPQTAAGVSITPYFANLSGVHALALAPPGVVFLLTADTDEVTALRDFDSDGVVDHVFRIPTGLRAPAQITVKAGALWVTNGTNTTHIEEIVSHTGLPPSPRPANSSPELDEAFARSTKLRAEHVQTVGNTVYINGKTAASFPVTHTLTALATIADTDILLADSTAGIIYHIHRTSANE